MNQLQLLYQLQQIDDRLRAGKRRLEGVIQALQGSQELQASRARKEAGDARLQQRRLQQKDLELELGGLTGKSQLSEQRLYSGKVKNPKELSDLEHEVASLKRRRSSLEDELLEAMMATEEAESEVTAAGRQLAAAEQAWNEQQATLSAERDRLRAELEARLAERQALVARVDTTLVAAYDNAVRRRGNTAVVRLQDGRCEGCGVSTSGNKARSVRNGEVTYCASCDRIMVPA